MASPTLASSFQIIILIDTDLILDRTFITKKIFMYETGRRVRKDRSTHVVFSNPLTPTLMTSNTHTIRTALVALNTGTKAPQHLNHAGAPSYRRSLKEQVLSVLSTNTLSDTFYVSKQQLAAETVEVIYKAREEDPRFLAHAIVWARKVGLMKTVPALALAILSGKRVLDKQLFRDAFFNTILTPDDLRTFVSCIVEGAIPGRAGLGGMVREVVREWVGGISEYHTLKYGSVRSKEITLRDILRMTHPKPATDAGSERFGYLVGRGVGSNSILNPQLASFEKLKRAETEEEIVSLIRQGKLPYEVVVPSVPKMTKAVWTELLYQAPYMNLLRSLNTLRENGVFDDEKCVEFAISKLTNPGAVEHSRVLPFRFFDALNAYGSGSALDMRIKDALRGALELSFVNLPSFGQDVHVTISPDVSGSMGSVPISEKGSTTCIDIAGIFTGALMKRTEKALVLPFDTSVRHLQLSKHDSVAETAQKIASVRGGGTALGTPIEYLLDRKIKTDIFIGLTDNEDWAYGSGYEVSGSFLSLWRRYKKEVNPNAVAFLVTLASYRDAVAPTSEKDVHFIYGWSDKVLSYIALQSTSGVSQVEAVEAMEFSAPAEA